MCTSSLNLSQASFIYPFILSETPCPWTVYLPILLLALNKVIIVKHHFRKFFLNRALCWKELFWPPTLSPVVSWLLGCTLAFSDDLLIRFSFPSLQFFCTPSLILVTLLITSSTPCQHLGLVTFWPSLQPFISIVTHWVLTLVAPLRPQSQISSLTISSIFLHSLILWTSSLIPFEPSLPSNLFWTFLFTSFRLRVPSYQPGPCLVWHTRITSWLAFLSGPATAVTWITLWTFFPRRQLSKLSSYVSKMCQLCLAWSSCW